MSDYQANQAFGFDDEEQPAGIVVHSLNARIRSLIDNEASKYSGTKHPVFVYIRAMNFILGYRPEVQQKLLDALNRLLRSVALSEKNGGAEAMMLGAIKIINDKADQVYSDWVKSYVSLPSQAPMLYEPRRSGKASDFLFEHWGEYIEGGVCFRPDIKRLDPKLEQALTNEFRGRTDELRAILPSKTDQVDAAFAENFSTPVRPEDRKAAATALSMAKRLKR